MADKNVHEAESASDVAMQATLAAALLDPAVYSVAGGARVEKLETHISWVFLADTWAYKVKKAVNFGFLDFSTLAARRFYCAEELRLNRRLAPQLYIEVVPITGSPEHPVLGGSGIPIEYAVKMRRFAQDDLLSRRLARGELTPPHIDRLVEIIAAFHASIAVASAGDTFGSHDAIRGPALENFAQIRSALSEATGRADLERLEQWTAGQCRLLERSFDQRKRDGFVRECHGDLHLGNIALVDDDVTVFDGIEFSDNLRWIDVMSEIAFLVMDLHDRGRPDLAHRLLNRYLEITGDYDGLRVLRFYVVYRALVRAKVHCLRAMQADVSAPERERLLVQYRHYIAQATKHMRDVCPRLIITHGLSGSGKTTRSNALLETCGAVRVRSDLERKRMQGVPPLARTVSGIAGGLYAEDVTVNTYRRLSELARTIIDSGYPAIVDATFLQHMQRQAFRGLAATLGVPFHILDVYADESTLRERIRARQRQGTDPSDADVAVLEHQLRTQEPLQQDELSLVLRADENVSETSS